MVASSPPTQARWNHTCRGVRGEPRPEKMLSVIPVHARSTIASRVGEWRAWEAWLPFFADGGGVAFVTSTPDATAPGPAGAEGAPRHRPGPPSPRLYDARDTGCRSRPS